MRIMCSPAIELLSQAAQREIDQDVQMEEEGSLVVIGSRSKVDMCFCHANLMSDL